MEFGIKITLSRLGVALKRQRPIARHLRDICATFYFDAFNKNYYLINVSVKICPTLFNDMRLVKVVVK